MNKERDELKEIILNNSKQEYNQIQVPEELSKRVNDVFDDYEVKQKKREMDCMKNSVGHKTNNKTKKFLARTGIGIVACFGIFVIGLNSSESFAKGVENIPLIGTVAKVLTIRSYEDANEDRTIKADVPQIEVESDNEDVKQVVVDINKEIQGLVDDHIKQAETHIAEYKDAFLETGGTEEEFKAKDIHANVDYEVKAQNDEMISIVITSYEDWANAYTEQFFYTLDLATGDVLTLKDIMGDDYIYKANQAIREEMEQRVKVDENLTYFTEEEGGFTSVDENTHFYVNEAGNPVVVFEKYEVAPGFMGIQEFEIKK
ncbi:RsiV family protein [Anaerosporobacter sp.]